MECKLTILMRALLAVALVAITLVLTYLFYWWGFFAGVIITLLAIAFNNTISGESYIYPIVPFDGKKLIRKLFRVRLPRNNA